MMQRARERLLMCAPTFFDVRYAINPWMQGAVPVDTSRSLTQWQHLAREIGLTFDVQVVTPDASLPDMCFAANAGLVYENCFIPSRFKFAQRRGEEKLFTRWFEDAGFDCVPLPDEIEFEGAGDALFDRERGCLWMGYGPRSELAAADAISAAINVSVFALHLVDPRFYHLDTCFCPLRNGNLIYFAGAFDRASLELIHALVPAHLRIEIEATDAVQLACNAVDLGDRILVNQASASLRRKLAKRGVDVREVAVGEFLKSGGAAKCMALPLDVSLRDAPSARPTKAQHAVLKEHATLDVPSLMCVPVGGAGA